MVPKIQEEMKAPKIKYPYTADEFFIWEEDFTGTVDIQTEKIMAERTFNRSWQAD